MAEGQVDVLQAAHNMRSNRVNMIQTCVRRFLVCFCTLLHIPGWCAMHLLEQRLATDVVACCLVMLKLFQSYIVYVWLQLPILTTFQKEFVRICFLVYESFIYHKLHSFIVAEDIFLSRFFLSFLCFRNNIFLCMMPCWKRSKPKTQPFLNHPSGQHLRKWVRMKMGMKLLWKSSMR